MPRPTVFLHIGVPKTGTTYLQDVVYENRAALRRAGLLYPATQDAHFWASQDLRGARFMDANDTHVRGAWGRLVKEIRSWPERSLIDHESLASARRPAIDRALADLDFADVHLVLTARDLARQLPAAWQERVKNGWAGTYGEFLASVRVDRHEREPSARMFWALQGLPNILGRWARDVPPDRVHIVTVPPRGSDPGLLWRRFAGLLGVDPQAYDSTPRIPNSSLDAAAAEVLRRFNKALDDLEGGVHWPVYAAVFKMQLAPALAARGGPPIELPEEYFEWTVEWSRSAVARLAEGGYDVVGDLDELVPRWRPEGQNPDSVPAEAQTDAAVAGMLGLVSIIAESRVGVTALRRAQRGPVARQVERLTARVALAAAMRDAYRRRFG